MAYYSDEGNIKTLWTQGKDAPSGLISRCILRAYNTINALLSIRYTLPFDSTPPLVESLSDDLTIFYLKRHLNPGAGDLDDETKNLYEDAKNELKDIALGKVPLVDSDGTLVAEKSSMSSSTEGYQPIFNLDDVKNHEIDSDRLDEIEDARD